ncbi:eukaryotic translation initiation factor 2-alpha kinase 1-like [Mytilus californianus]|uniref:eukaryotic translation initiation factor 2-alpha kinase 1-like n=1 Tax=Mytilus californianus TaxID=6549 RepID=UPI0022466702|nr:eukaryotic translation initiation factor 2-alpha kinase 1-like [Mytilus californianus]
MEQDNRHREGLKEHSEDIRLPNSTSRKEIFPSFDVEFGRICRIDNDSSESMFNSGSSNSGTYNSELSGNNTDSQSSSQSLDLPTLEEFSNNARIQKDFVVLSKLGEGGFGAVFKGLHKVDNNLYALKVIPHQSKDQELISKEAKVFCQFNHPNIVRYHNSWILTEEDSAEDEDDDKSQEQQDDDTFCIQFEEQDEESHSTDGNQLLFIQMEFCNITLRQRIDNADLSKDVKSRFLNEILEGIGYIHNEGVMHRDLNPKNIFLKNGTIKIGDFGSARNAVQYEDGLCRNMNGCKIMEDVMTEYIGTLPYCAPELTSRRYDKRVDLYSLGFILYELIYPFPQNTTEQQKEPVIKGLRLKQIEIPEVVQGSTRHIILKLLDHDPDERMTLLDIKQYLEKDISNQLDCMRKNGTQVYEAEAGETDSEIYCYIKEREKSKAESVQDIDMNSSAIPRRKELVQESNKQTDYSDCLNEQNNLHDLQRKLTKLQQNNFVSTYSLLSEEEKEEMVQNIKQQNTNLEQQKKVMNTLSRRSDSNTQVTSSISSKKVIHKNPTEHATIPPDE